MRGTWWCSPVCRQLLKRHKTQLLQFFGVGCCSLNRVKDRESGRSPVPWEFWSKPLEMGMHTEQELQEGTAEMERSCLSAHHPCQRLFWKPRKSLNMKTYFQRQTNLKISHKQTWSVGDIPIRSPHPSHFISPCQQSVLVRSSNH